MTDNRTTEKLRKLLDERGVEYTTNDHMGAYETSWNGFTATQLSPNANLIMAVTPEQAIAATLCGGKLTANDVLNAVYKHGARWQAIADELNAELGGDTCENIAPDYLDFLCNKCGFVHYHSDENDTGDGNDWNFCPTCGGRVKAVKR